MVSLLTSLLLPGYYGNEMDGVVTPKTKGKKGDGDEEETELIHNSSDEEMDDDGDLSSVATTPPMKPVITDRSYIHYQSVFSAEFVLKDCETGLYVLI